MNLLDAPRHVSLLALPECVISTLTGIYDVLSAFALMNIPAGPGAGAPFEVEIVGAAEGELMLASGMPVTVRRAVADVASTDIVIVPSVLLRTGAWSAGRYPELVAWLRRMHEGGALLCSACSGVFLLAETGLFDGRAATVHYGYARAFELAYPAVSARPEQVLVIAGEREELITSGASMSWHDLVLYLIARHAGTAAAHTVARMFALQWHRDGLAPYIVFEGRSDHGDAVVAAAQRWVERNFAAARPVEDMVRQSALAARSFQRRFAAATGMTPLEYVHRLRVEDAKRRLERTASAVEEIGWKVGYEDAAFFRRLFKRIAGVPPGEYRKRFRMPDFARPGTAAAHD